MGLDANSSVSPTVVSGTYTGTGAAATLTIGFRPSWVIIWNQTDGDKVVFWHNSDQANIQTVDTEAANESVAVVPTDHGLTLTSSASVNESAKVFVFIAGR